MSLECKYTRRSESPAGPTACRLLEQESLQFAKALVKLLEPAAREEEEDVSWRGLGLPTGTLPLWVPCSSAWRRLTNICEKSPGI